MEIIIRNYEKRDQKKVYDLITKILIHEFKITDETYPETDLKNIHKSYGGKRDIFLVATAGPKIIGTVAIKEDDKDTALLRRIFVSSDYRGLGIGKRLIIKAIEFCENNDYRLVIFRSTNTMKTANDLCQKNGFKIRGSMGIGDITVLKLIRRLRKKKR